MKDSQLLDGLKAKRDDALVIAIRAYRKGLPFKAREWMMRADLYWTMIQQLEHLITSEPEDYKDQTK
jgi:hypothetical protein